MYGWSGVPLFDERDGDAPDAVDRNGVSVAAARAGADRGGQPDHLSVEIDQRAARVAGVDVGVGQKIAALASCCALRRPAGPAADDPGGDRLVEPQRAADGQHPLARPSRSSESPKRAAERSRGGCRIRTTATSLPASRPTSSAGKRAPIDEHDRDRLRFAADGRRPAVEDVAAGDDVPARVEDDARGGRVLVGPRSPPAGPPTARWPGRPRRTRGRAPARGPARTVGGVTRPRAGRRGRAFQNHERDRAQPRCLHRRSLAVRQSISRAPVAGGESARAKSAGRAAASVTGARPRPTAAVT